MIRRGRRHLYDTHETSGLGHTACASCHVDGRMDRLAWDLGLPACRSGPETRGGARANLDGGVPGFQCVPCHTLPVGVGPDLRLEGLRFVPVPPGPNSERHHALVSVGTGRRLGIDRDDDGFGDRTEVLRGTDPADPSDFPR